MKAPTINSARDTLQQIAPYILRTPSTQLDISATDNAFPKVVLKLELMQRTGTFKLRGALANLLNAPTGTKRVTAVSAGNHAVAVACAAAELGMHAKVVLFNSANRARRALVSQYGAEIEFTEGGKVAFEQAERLVKEEGRLMVHPFEGPVLASATGGIAMELLEDAPDLDAVVVAIGGGGLAAGISAITKAIKPDCAVYGVEPFAASAMHQSLVAGHPLTGIINTSIADSLSSPLTIDYSFNVCREHLDDLVLISDDDMCRSVYLLFRHAKIAVEPAGAAAFAALIGPLKERLAGKRVGVIVCGACMDAESYAGWLERGARSLLDRHDSVGNKWKCPVA